MTYETFLYSYSHLLTYVVTKNDKINGMPLFELFIRILAQILGGLMAYRLGCAIFEFLARLPSH